MHALILSAGRGSRMGSLTDRTPKPLLYAGQRRLIEHQIDRLAAAGIRDIVINTGWLANQFEPALGNGSRYGVTITWSREPKTALETGGGIRQALKYLPGDRFLTVNGDVFCDIDYGQLQLAATDDAHLVMVDNPDFHPEGDFWMRCSQVSDGWQMNAVRRTFSGIGVYRRSVFASLPHGRYPLAPILRDLMDYGRVSGTWHNGRWLSVDTPERLETVAQWTAAKTPRADRKGHAA